MTGERQPPKHISFSNDDPALQAEIAAAFANHPLTTEEPATPGLENKVLELNQVHHEDEKVDPAVIEHKPDPNMRTEEIEDDFDEYHVDEELERTTNANRHIPPMDPLTITRTRTKSLRRRELLVFSGESSTIRKSDRVVVTHFYGQTGDAGLPRHPRSYLVACDFSDESFYAMEWVMGTMMRDGDTLHVLTVVNREDNPETVKAHGMSLSKEVGVNAMHPYLTSLPLETHELLFRS